MFTLKVIIDQEACIGCGVCSNVCMEVFEMEGPVSQIVNEYQGNGPKEGDVPDSINCVDSAVEQCPVDAIEIKD